MIYLLIFFILLFYIFIKETKKNNGINLILPSIILGGLISFRSIKVGTDSMAYSTFFIGLKNLSYKSIIFYHGGVYEKAPGWCFLFKFIGDIFGYTDNVYLFSSGFIVIFLVLISIRLLSVNYKKSYFVYYLILFLSSLNGTRTFIAIGLTTIAIALILKGKRYLPIVLWFIAFTIHKISIIGIVLVIISKIRWNKKKIVLFIVISIISSLFLSTFVNQFVNLFDEYGSVLSSEDLVSGKNIFYQIAYITLILYSYNILSNNDFSYLEKQKIETFIIYIILEVVIGIVGYKTWYLQRINQFLQVYTIFLLPEISAFKCKNSIIYKTIIYSIYILGFIYMLITNNSNVLPYTTWL